MTTPFHAVLALIAAGGVGTVRAADEPVRSLDTSSQVVAASSADIVDVRQLGAKCDGIADDSGSLRRAASAAARTSTDVLIPCRVRISSGTGTVSAGIRFVRDGALDVVAGGSVNVFGEITAGLRQIFLLRGGALTLSRSGQAVSPEWWGAKRDGIADDTTAIQSAIDASLASGERAVLLHGGEYRITRPLRLFPQNGPPRGASLSGAGRYQTYIVVDGGLNTDGLLLSNPSGYGYGGRISGLTVQAKGNDRKKARDLLSVTYWTGATFEDVALNYSGRSGIHIRNSMDLRFQRIAVQFAGGDGVYVTGPEIFNTTLHFDHCYFFRSGRNGADVWASSVTFHACIFERSGESGVPRSGHGIRLRSGHMNVTGACHFEANLGHDIYIEGDGGPDPVNYTTFLVENALHYFGGRKSAEYNGVCVKNANGGTIIGGYWQDADDRHRIIDLIGGPRAKGIRVVSASSQTRIGSEPAAMGVVANLRNVNGIVEYYEPSSGKLVMAGEYRVEAGGGLAITTTAPRPSCDAEHRGWFWFTPGGVGSKDQVEVCAKDAANAYRWRALY